MANINQFVCKNVCRSRKVLPAAEDMYPHRTALDHEDQNYIRGIQFLSQIKPTSTETSLSSFPLRTFSWYVDALGQRFFNAFQRPSLCKCPEGWRGTIGAWTCSPDGVTTGTLPFGELTAGLRIHASLLPDRR
jgi:hypothetical protein